MVMAAASVTVVCDYCGESFVARRKSAKFCSTRCRKNWSRRKDRIDSEVESIRAALTNIERHVQKWPDLRQYADVKLSMSDILKPYYAAAQRGRDAVRAAKAATAPTAPGSGSGPTAPTAANGSTGSEVSHENQ